MFPSRIPGISFAVLATAVLVGINGIGRADQPPSDKHQPRWEYMDVYCGGPRSELPARLNKMGAKGWELIQIADKWAVFKRQKAPEAASTPGSVQIEYLDEGGSGPIIIRGRKKDVQRATDLIRDIEQRVPKPTASGKDVAKLAKEKRKDDERKLRFAFRAQPWGDVLEWFAENAGLSLVTDGPLPSGSFSYVNERAFTVTESMDVLNAVLLTKGYLLLRHGRMLFVIDTEEEIPRELVLRVTIDDLNKYGEFEFVCVMFPLGQQNVEKVLAEVRPLLGPRGSVIVLPQARQMLVTERGGTVRAIKAIIDSIPQPDAQLGADG